LNAIRVGIVPLHHPKPYDVGILSGMDAVNKIINEAFCLPLKFTVRVMRDRNDCLFSLLVWDLNKAKVTSISRGGKANATCVPIAQGHHDRSECPHFDRLFDEDFGQLNGWKQGWNIFHGLSIWVDVTVKV
jgi:hypothetical protein